MSADNILYWIAVVLVAIGAGLSFTRWWHPSLFFLALGSAVCTLSSLVRGQWPTDFIMAAIAAVYGLAIIYVACHKEREHARTEEHEGQEHGVLPEGPGGPAKQRRLPLGLRRPGRQRRTGSDQPPRPL